MEYVTGNQNLTRNIISDIDGVNYNSNDGFGYYGKFPENVDSNTSILYYIPTNEPISNIKNLYENFDCDENNVILLVPENVSPGYAQANYINNGLDVISKVSKENGLSQNTNVAFCGNSARTYVAYTYAISADERGYNTSVVLADPVTTSEDSAFNPNRIASISEDGTVKKIKDMSDLNEHLKDVSLIWLGARDNKDSQFAVGTVKNTVAMLPDVKIYDVVSDEVSQYWNGPTRGGSGSNFGSAHTRQQQTATSDNLWAIPFGGILKNPDAHHIYYYNADGWEEIAYDGIKKGLKINKTADDKNSKNLNDVNYVYLDDADSSDENYQYTNFKWLSNKAYTELMDKKEKYLGYFGNDGICRWNDQELSEDLINLRNNIIKINDYISIGIDYYPSTTKIPNIEVDKKRIIFNNIINLFIEMGEFLQKIKNYEESIKDLEDKEMQELEGLGTVVTNPDGIIGNDSHFNWDIRTDFPKWNDVYTDKNKLVYLSDEGYKIVIHHNGEKILGVEHYYDFTTKENAQANYNTIVDKYKNEEYYGDTLINDRYIKMIYNEDSYKDISFSKFKENYKELKIV